MKKWIAALVVLGTMSVSGARADISVSVPDFAHLRETVSLSTAGHSGAAVVDWGDGVLFDRTRTWNEYTRMVSDGLLRPVE